MKKFLFAMALMIVAEAPAMAASVGSVNFHAVGKGLALDCDGKADGVTADGLKVEGGKLLAGKFSVKVESLKTGMGLRDTHLHELLKSKQNPTIEFTPAVPLELKDGPFSGDMKIAGVTNKVSGKLSVAGKKATFKGPVKLSDFKITPPEWKGTTIDNVVEVTVEANIL